MRLASLTGPELIFPDLASSDPDTLLLAVSQRMTEAGVVRNADELYRLLQEREALGSTGIGSGVAIPHCKASGVNRVRVSVGLARKGIDFDAPDGKRVRLFFTVVSPPREAAAHLQALAAISRWVKQNQHVRKILKRRSAAAIYELLSEGGE